MKALWLLLTLAVFGLDALVKSAVSSNMRLGETFALVPHVLSITYVENTGVSFSMLGDNAAAMAVITWLTPVLCAVLIVLLIRNKYGSRLFDASLALILAGAIGNAVDRMLHGSVVDMFEFAFVRFAIFNVADVALTCGCAMLAIYAVLDSRRMSGANRNAG
ncbi:MAG: signal peptidase II [Oscillospiraceae bacterium]|jgi:signal peptidase II|nr:signal peptidase II [Oscillospiraceae bacterium]